MVGQTTLKRQLTVCLYCTSGVGGGGGDGEGLETDLQDSVS